MLFREIPGNIDIKNELISSVKNNRISHAQLLFGQSGSGQLPLAIAYARYINCENKLEDDSCGNCTSCIKYHAISHPDLHLVFPVIKQHNGVTVSDNFVQEWRKFVIENPYLSVNDWLAKISQETTKNKTGAIYKDEAISIQKKILLKNFEASYKVVLFWMPERMNRETANKILKTIEEPPKKTVFLLVSEKPADILPTIYSRLQKIKIKKFSKHDIEKYFDDNVINKEVLNELQLITERNLGQLKQLIEGGAEELNLFKHFSSWMRFVYKSDIIEINKWCNNMSLMSRQEQILFVSYSLKIIRDCLLFNISSNKLIASSRNEQEFVKRFAPFVHEENIFLIVSELEKSNRYLKRNANAKILFYSISLKMIKYLKLKRKFVNKD
tara:strand:+ start:40007 stop:41158 length:1152 start_codon:yes stop_codon:yes gene_type:complete